MIISEAFDLYIFEGIKLQGGAEKTQKNYVTAKSSILQAIGDIPVALVSLDHVTRWKLFMDSRGNQVNTIKGNLGRLRSVLAFLKARGIAVMDYRDITLPKVERKGIQPLDYEEVQAIIDVASNPRDKAIVACLFSTGCRVSELLNLNRGDIIQGTARVIGKGSKIRPVYFDKTALELLEAYEDGRKDRLPPLFISGQYRRLTVSRVEQILHVLASEAGIEKNVTPHVFRHSTITDYIKNGADMYAVQKIAGHASIQTTLNIYTHLSDKYTKEAFDKFHSR